MLMRVKHCNICFEKYISYRIKQPAGGKKEEFTSVERSDGGQ
jgi:hypothetical protein